MDLDSLKFKQGDKVRCYIEGDSGTQEEYPKEFLGTIFGVSFQHIITVWIVLLDESEKDLPGYPFRCVSLPEGLIRPL